MNKLRFLLLLLLPVFFLSCMDTREELVIRNNGSGTLVMKTDLSKMLDMMKSFASDSDIRKEGLNRPFDTTMMMSSYLDTAKDITPEKKELFKEGSVHINLNIKESVGKLDIRLPFNSPEHLQKIYENLNSATGGLKGLMGGIGNAAPGAPGGPGADQGLPQIGSVYDVQVKNGFYSRKLNKDRYADFSKSMKLDDLKSLSGMLGTMEYTLSINLERPIKKISNPKATLSADKKTATLKVDLLESFEHPEIMELEIEY